MPFLRPTCQRWQHSRRQIRTCGRRPASTRRTATGSGLLCHSSTTVPCCEIEGRDGRKRVRGSWGRKIGYCVQRGLRSRAPPLFICTRALLYYRQRSFHPGAQTPLVWRFSLCTGRHSGQWAATKRHNFGLVGGFALQYPLGNLLGFVPIQYQYPVVNPSEHRTRGKLRLFRQQNCPPNCARVKLGRGKITLVAYFMDNGVAPTKQTHLCTCPFSRQHSSGVERGTSRLVATTRLAHRPR